MVRLWCVWRARLGGVVAGLALAASGTLAACGGSPTPTPVPTPTPAPTATATRAVGAASPGASPVANPAAVTSAFANLQRLDSYHLVVTATGFDRILPLGLSNNLTLTTDYHQGDQHTTVTDGAGLRQDVYKVGDKTYLVDNNATPTEVTNPPLLVSLPALLYLNLTAPGVTTFHEAGSERVNGRDTTKYVGTGNLSGLAANPLLANALAGASGAIQATVWIDQQGGYLVAGDLTIETTNLRVATPALGFPASPVAHAPAGTPGTPGPTTAHLRIDVTQIGQVGPIQPPR
ncbi:MAG TPA: LppX_LprAFG lipoprotein [Thermomicrobiales bacterium]|nr:LppX_LprAFG lipoprotein [Thermomicrobiales bacterium]